MTTPTPTATTAAAQIKSAAADAAHQLSAFVAAQTGKSVDAFKAFGEEFGPQYAEFAGDLVAAKAAGDAAAESRAETDLDELNDVALLDAAMVAIDAESAGESTALNVLNKFVGVLIARLTA